MRNPDPAAQITRFLCDYTPASEASRATMNEVREQYANLARWLQEQLPPGPEKTAGMRKLLEAKDAHVRAVIETGR